MPHGLENRTLIAAHRAGAGLWPENSLTAFRNAMMLDVDFIEFDVHRTRDGVLVVHHDAVLGRTVDGTGAIAEADWQHVRTLPLKGAPQDHIPLLAEILVLFDASRIRPRIELKSDHNGERYPDIAADVMTLLRATGLAGRATITSFDPHYLDEAYEAGARDLIWLLREDAAAELAADPAGFSRQARMRGITEVAIRGRDATPDLVDACRENSLTLGAFAAKDMDCERLLQIGLSVFTTDRPDLALAAKAAIYT